MKKLIVLGLTLAPAISFGQSANDVLYGQFLANQSINMGYTEQTITPKSIYITNLPTTVGTPSFTGNFTRFSDTAFMSVWRQSINGVQRLFIQVIPTSSSFFFCPGGKQFTITQGGLNYGGAFAATKGDGVSVCNYLVSPDIFVVDQWTIYQNFDESKAFVMSFDQSLLPGNYSGSISVSDAVIVTPVPTPSPTLAPTPTPTACPIIATPPATTYDRSTGKLILPSVIVGPDIYSASMVYAGQDANGNDIFRLEAATKK